MTQNNPSAWHAEPRVNDVFMNFPLSIAMLDQSGKIQLANAHFTRQFDPAIVESEDLRKVVREPDRSWQPVRVAGRDGGIVEAWAQAMRIQDSVMLVVDDAATARTSREAEELKKRISALEKQSASDYLTGAWNRAHLDRSIVSEIARSGRLRQPVSLVLIDIDHFKRINDTYGHQAGDTVLRELVAVIAARVRQADLLFRWGGEEFVIVATSTGYRNAEILAESLRALVEGHPFEGVGRLTVSIGIAEHLEPETAEAWFHRVDEALYRAKDAGRNRISVDRRGSSDAWAAQNGRSALRLEWLDAYDSGHPLIDQQHRELFELANIVIGASFSSATAPLPFHLALDNLLAHIARHFRDEEAVLEQHGYPRLASHKAAHASLLRRAAELKAQALANNLAIGTLIEFLANDVAARHMFSADRDFFPLVGGPGAASAPG